ncbi:carbohydrate esterase family 1 protein [Durotheca rogersii]|uniref:carbohydrate esterase family 1 protein n=1 Tax=Durotheca rogersii TaxID=419775 RepID=UPI00221E8FDB|nr:carbohydrate esterase family 1 protein [Durotheca rogersii]KAI5863666.1 carbohydrate esterase family 1 protein [Durotheca rogersii]
MRGPTITGVLAALLASPSTYAALTQISSWGQNPTNLNMAVYMPAKLAERPAIILALHYCGGTGQAYHQTANYDRYADAKGFIVVYPTTNKDSNCWDVASKASLTNNGGGDSTGLVNMVKYLTEKYNADPAQIYATGASSGCMMTNVLLAAYPDVFAAGSCYSGVAAGCLAGSPGSSPQSADPKCASGQVVKTGAQWAEQVRAMHPSFNGSYPRMQTFHGEADNFVDYKNLAEQLKEWSALLGVEFARNQTNTPLSGYTKIVYGDGTKLVGYSARGVGHIVPPRPQLDLEWFGLA